MFQIYVIPTKTNFFFWLIAQTILIFNRMRVLEVHNNQLEMQLGKLRTLLNSDGGPAHGGSAGHPAQRMMTNGNNGGLALVGGGGLHGVIPASITSNKTGTLNTKAVTASQLATNSPVLPHKMNGNGPAPPNSTTSKDQNGGGGRGDPPALPPRGVSVRSATGKPPPPAVPPKRSSLTRSDLALFENVS